MKKYEVYYIEDDADIACTVKEYLEHRDFHVSVFSAIAAAKKALDMRLPSVVLIDWNMPDGNGRSLCRWIRSRWRELPVIFLTVRGDTSDIVTGFDNGADDYICKPFGIMELLSRIKALLRRAKPESAGKAFTAGGLYVDPEKHIVRASGMDVILTLKEFELLCLFIAHPGTVFTRDQILQKIWGFEFDGENRTVDVHIRTLRTKLGDCGEQIETVRGIGYKISG